MVYKLGLGVSESVHGRVDEFLGILFFRKLILPLSSSYILLTNAVHNLT